MNMHVNKLKYSKIISQDCFCNGIQSHWPEEVIPDPYDKCKPGLNTNYRTSFGPRSPD